MGSTVAGLDPLPSPQLTEAVKSETGAAVLASVKVATAMLPVV